MYFGNENSRDKKRVQYFINLFYFSCVKIIKFTQVKNKNTKN